MPEVLYRKYRPRSFKDVLGQDAVVEALQGAIKLGRVSHAYLFSGSRGTGKTSVARILAKELGTSEADLYEIDAASNRGIDEIRLLRDGVTAAPFDSKYKVYIIDEAHMLTKEAWNALLKTLEEPPAHAVFILATTELEKVPETIISRCQTFTFKRPTQKILKETAERISKKEGFAIESPAAELVALLADGSYRDAQGILQKAIGISKDANIALLEVEKITGAPKGTLVNSIIESLEKKDAAIGLFALQKAVEQNVDIKIFAKLLLAKLRFVLLLRNAPEMEKAIKEEVSVEDFEFLKKTASAKDSRINSTALLEFLNVYDLIGYAALPELPLELAVIKLCGGEK
ncbi:MAG TPA: DNA polymerase III subunit gamma/tau [Candidatus Taylorbacteria bacterium]|nr:MAG: polymerase III, subunit gamma and tau protein [Parcubacteria group bacterium GW2011_GWA2_47_64]KKU97119.1 MAG: polymerase III, subunit gamma and tau protein [Parcubacteria group bacterium GW2011_GWC2_48_17]HBV01570.1 DNA polymerase III subunit gamma/tau [Candidatus Taylorbacteria bacterium]